MHWLHDFAHTEICQFPCLSDNYGYLIRDKQSGECAAIDTPDATAIRCAADEIGWNITQIWNTHWHMDHTGGNNALKDALALQVIGPKGENGRIPVADQLVTEADSVTLGATTAQIIETPGHTLGHIVYYIAKDQIAFVGDTIFALGCGRLFEGDAAQMWHSLGKIRLLPKNTQLFCAHEYTSANAEFALTIETSNAALQQRSEAIKSLRAENTPTVPMSLLQELETNPFLRADHPNLIEDIKMPGHTPSEVFAEIRHRKDNF